jgi:hypothetical protein
MRLDPDHALSPASVDLVLSSLPPTPERSPVEETELVQFALGLAAPERRAEIVSALASSHRLRARLVHLCEEVRQARATPFAELAASPSPFNETLVAEEGAAIAGYVRPEGSPARRDLDRLWKDATAEARAFRAALAAIARSFSSLSALPTFAAARSATTGAGVVGDGSDLADWQLFAEIDADGALNVSAEGRARTASAPETLQGREATLELLDPAGGHIPIGTGPVDALHWSLSLPEFAALSGFPVGVVPGGRFRLRIGEAAAPPAMPGYLLAELASTGGTLPLELRGKPSVSDERLSLRLAASRPLAEEFPRAVLEVGIPVANALQILARIPLADWTSTEYALVIPIPGARDGTLASDSLVCLRIVMN